MSKYKGFETFGLGDKTTSLANRIKSYCSICDCGIEDEEPCHGCLFNYDELTEERVKAFLEWEKEINN